MANSNPLLSKLKGNIPVLFGGMLVPIIVVGGVLFSQYRASAAQVPTIARSKYKSAGVRFPNESLLWHWF